MNKKLCTILISTQTRTRTHICVRVQLKTILIIIR